MNPKIRSRFVARLVALAAVASAGGCGTSAPTASVGGTVLVGDKPVAAAQVQFIPTSDVNLGTIVATTDAAGRFTADRDAAGGPARPGTYVVLVSRPGPGGSMESPAKDDLPDQYQDRGRTPFKADIRPGANELPPFVVSGVRGR